MASIQGNDFERQSDETFQLLCSPCKRKERNKEADKYCTDCNDYYCSDCVKFHEDIPALSQHKILDKGQAREGTSKGLPIAPTERCERHRFKPVDMYCQNHDDVGCYTCMAVDHRSCQDVFYIPEYVRDNDTTTDSADVQKEMQGVADELKRQLDKYQREVKRLFKRKEEEVEKIKAFRIQIDRRLDVVEKESIDEIEKKYQAFIQKIEADSCQLKTSQQDVSSSHDSITSGGSNTSQQFVSKKRGKTVTEQAKKSIADKTTDFIKRDIAFECNQKLQSLLEELNCFGEILQKHVLYKLEGKKLYNMKHVSDTLICGRLGTCILPDGTVIIADCSNKTLKRLDPSSYAVDDILNLPNGPWQVCTLEKNEVAVCFGSVSNINLVAVKGKLQVVKEIKTNHKCYGIAYYNSNIYVSDSQTTLFVYNMAGTKLTQFSEDQSGQALFRDIYRIVVSNNGERIYVADTNYGLIVLNMDGMLLGKHNTSELKGVRDICETKGGHVFVCGEKSNNIIQFAPSCEVVGEVLSRERDKGGCQAICFDRRRSKLIVGRSSTEEIEIYDVV
ncbi:uncharacterized protein LOC123531368 isoform X2 [Mercenaria mercenaria]|uniref:uncharacterized protein LOC123531368 isoform X2 n=1 Tax=Mercenaria mercenaria TaxID=6596 RepID=UPI00234ED9D2|nr:uncharacterized protein LOC123531368 isoform X2 [Mercenaria mercenaria]